MSLYQSIYLSTCLFIHFPKYLFYVSFIIMCRISHKILKHYAYFHVSNKLFDYDYVT